MANPSDQDAVVQYVTRRGRNTGIKFPVNSRQRRADLAFYCCIMINNSVGHRRILDNGVIYTEQLTNFQCLRNLFCSMMVVVSTLLPQSPRSSTKSVASLTGFLVAARNVLAGLG